jgi:hypothetical protein
MACDKKHNYWRAPCGEVTCDCEYLKLIVDTMTEQEEIKLLIKLLKKWFGTCKEPFEDKCAGCDASKLMKLLKNFYE